eukprot:NODE_420_length_8944_cov_0.479819.p2 type:complete len:269 gc:universal NODE_420_length_8944_cov_0.479819:1954-2760(+)
MLSTFNKGLFKNKLALITGGGSGINLGITRALMELGCDTIILSRNQEKLAKVSNILEKDTLQKCYYISADVRNFDDLQFKISDKLTKLNKQLDFLFCGAAGNFLVPFKDMSPNAFKTVLEIDLFGTFHTVKACLPYIKKDSNSCIVNISATLHYMNMPLQAHASAAKAAIDSLTISLANELAPIRVVAIAPGPVEGTEGLSRLLPASFKEDKLKVIPLKRFGKAEDIAGAAVFLCSPAANYITATVLVVDGGSWRTDGLIFQLARSKL